MPGSFKKDDLRVVKTRKVILAALSGLLETRNFNKITVYHLSEEAQISRSTFYAHFMDKYELLEFWLSEFKSRMSGEPCAYEAIEKKVNDYVSGNKNTVRNLIENADNETRKLLGDFLLSLLNITAVRTDAGKINQRDIVLSNIGRGALLQYLSWQAANKFPESLPVMNPLIYEFLLYLKKWGETQKST